MTRLDASNEPSMEDILASIRKIIAEDPPGSRPVPPPSPVSGAPRAASVTAQPAASVFGRAPAPDPYLSRAQSPSLSPIAAAPEPYLRSMPSRSDTPSLEPSPFFMPKGEPAPAPATNRIEPSFAPFPSTTPAPAVETPAAAPLEPAALSVEAQLSDLLDEVAPAAAPLSSANPEPAPIATSEAKPQVDFAAKLMGRPAQQVAMQQIVPVEDTGPSQPEVRPGFSISRDGYVPSKADVPMDRDPFDFDLGPSPFGAKAAPATPGSDLGAVFSSRPSDAGAAEDLGIAFAGAPAVARESVADQTAPITTGAETNPFFNAPSVAATIEPKAGAQEPKFETHATSTSDASVPETVILELADDEASIEHVTPEPYIEALRSPFRNEIFAASHHAERESGFAAPAEAASAPFSLPVATHRTMEDTVADLLRPMLKTWLADNMPRIVERALRRELSEQLHSEHKTAAE